MTSTLRAKPLSSAAIALTLALVLGAAPASASAADDEVADGWVGTSAAASTSSVVDAAGVSTSSVVVCDNEVLNLNDQDGKPLAADRVARAKAALNYLCDGRGKAHAAATGSWVTNTTKSEVKTCNCGSRYKSWWVKITAAGLHTSGEKWVDVIWRIGPGGSGKWNYGGSNFIGPTTRYANLPLVSGTMGLGNYVQTVGTYTRNGKVQEQIWGGA